MVNPQMVMYEEEFNQIQTVVDRLVKDANARVVFIVDKNGQLILPKLFRRVTSYLQDVARGKFSGNLKQWLIASRDTALPQDDLVDVSGVRQNLSDLVTVSGSSVRFSGDPLELVFIEK